MNTKKKREPKKINWRAVAKSIGQELNECLAREAHFNCVFMALRDAPFGKPIRIGQAQVTVIKLDITKYTDQHGYHTDLPGEE